VTGTLQVLILYSEIRAQVPLSMLKTFQGMFTGDTFIGREPFRQAFGPFDAEDVVFSSNPGRISVSSSNFSARPKEAFGGAFKEGFNEIVSDSHIHELTR